jgi:hypothetical protein
VLPQCPEQDGYTHRVSYTCQVVKLVVNGCIWFQDIIQEKKMVTELRHSITRQSVIWSRLRYPILLAISIPSSVIHTLDSMYAR